MQRLNHTDQEAVRMTYGIYEICALAEPVLEDYLEILYGNANQTDAVCNANLDKNERFMISVDSQNNQRENHPNAWKKGDINWNREYLTSEQITDTKRKEAGTDKRKAESKETKEGREKQETGLNMKENGWMMVNGIIMFVFIKKLMAKGIVIFI